MSFLSMGMLGITREEQYADMTTRLQKLRMAGAPAKYPDEFSLLEDAMNYPANRDSLTALQNIEKYNLVPLERKLEAAVKPTPIPNGSITPSPSPKVFDGAAKWVALAVAGFVIGGFAAMILKRRR